MGIFRFYKTEIFQRYEIESLKNEIWDLRNDNQYLKDRIKELHKLIDHKEEVIKSLKEHK